jgi:hypothetical protein
MKIGLMSGVKQWALLSATPSRRCSKSKREPRDLGPLVEVAGSDAVSAT